MRLVADDGREIRISRRLHDVIMDAANRNGLTGSQMLWLLVDSAGLVDPPIASRKAPAEQTLGPMLRVIRS